MICDSDTTDGGYVRVNEGATAMGGRARFHESQTQINQVCTRLRHWLRAQGGGARSRAAWLRTTVLRWSVSDAKAVPSGNERFSSEVEGTAINAVARSSEPQFLMQHCAGIPQQETLWIVASTAEDPQRHASPPNTAKTELSGSKQTSKLAKIFRTSLNIWRNSSENQSPTTVQRKAAPEIPEAALKKSRYDYCAGACSGMGIGIGAAPPPPWPPIPCPIIMRPMSGIIAP